MYFQRSYLLVILVLTACAVAKPYRPTSVVEPSAMARPTAKPPVGTIAFASSMDGQYDIYTVNSDSSQITRITNTPAIEQMLYWSPDGKYIAFPASADLSTWGVYIVNIDHPEPILLGQSSSSSQIAWSPNSERIVFSRPPTGDNKGGIFLVDILTKATVPITGNGEYVDLCCPAWSPDGKWIAFTGNQGKGWLVYLTDLSSQQTRSIPSEWTGWKGFPVWSPDGRYILFTVEYAKNNYEIGKIDIANNATVTLTSNPASDLGSTWSPDGTKIAFFSNRDGRSQIYGMNADGSNQTNLTHDQSVNMTPSWASDGQWIVYQCNGNICMINANGTTTLELAKAGQGSPVPVWRP